MPETTPPPAPIKPGEGVLTDLQNLKPIKDALQDGTYGIDQEAQQGIRDALNDASSDRENAKTVLDIRNNKVFRNAYTSLITESIWPSYLDLVTDQIPGLYSVGFDGGKSRLARMSEEHPEIASASAAKRAALIAVSNHDILTHYCCEALAKDIIPPISTNPGKNTDYFEAFREQTDLAQRSHRVLQLVPPEAGSPSTFITSGLAVLRIFIFGIPNLISKMAQKEDIQLNPDQHRTGVSATISEVALSYYLPNVDIAQGISAQLINLKTGALLLESWRSTGDPDKFMVFPDPAIVQNVNEIAATMQFPVQTNCPAFRSRVPSHETSGAFIPLSRSLASVVMHQLDTRFYPQLEREYEGARK